MWKSFARRFSQYFNIYTSNKPTAFKRVTLRHYKQLGEIVYKTNKWSRTANLTPHPL